MDAAAQAYRPRLRGLLPADWVLAGYFAATAILLLRAPGHAIVVPLAVRLAFFAILFGLRRWPVPRNRFWSFLRLAYPVVFYPYCYAELDLLNTLVTTSRFDEAILVVERAVFRSMPSVELRAWLPWRPLSELLHFAYLSYYLVPSFVVLVLFARHRDYEMAETTAVITATFVACYVCFIFVPVVGPFHHLVPPDPEPLGVVATVVHRILHAGSSVGTAFPSSHVAIATAALLQAIRYDRMAAIVLWVIVPCLALGAVYGGFHYAIDASCGAVLALLVNPIARALSRRGLPKPRVSPEAPES